MRRHHRPQKRHPRGTIIAFFLVLIAVLTTSVISSMALVSASGAQVAGLTLKRDQAYYAAEAGIQRAWWLLQANNNWRTSSSGPLTGNIGNATYTVTAVGDWNSPILITSVGRIPAAGISVTVTAACSPAVLVPAIALGNNFDNSGNVTINGDVQAKGNITTSGRMYENGSLYAGGQINTSGSVEVTGASAPNTPNITVPVVDMAWLRNHATVIVNVPLGQTTDITSINLGQGGIVYFKGGAIRFRGNVTIYGYGTVVSEGDVTIHAAASFGSSSAPANANIVAAGSLDVSGYLGILGSIYTGGNITKNGGLDVTGVIVGQADLETNGGLTITRAQPPSWDPRSQSAGAGTMKLSRITGPIF